MSDLDPAAMSWLADHHGVITVAELRRCGVGRPTRERLLRLGVLEQVHKGVFVTAIERDTIAQRAAALCAAHPAGFVTGPTAGVLLGLRRMPVTSALHFSIRHGARVDLVPGVHFRQTTAITGADRRELGDGITVAAWARLAFDLAADLSELDLRSVLHQLVRDGRVSATALAAIERRLGHPRRPGSGPFRRALEGLHGVRPHDSHPEVELAEALRARGVPVESQVVVKRPGRREAWVDLGVRDVRWGVELDIHPEHHTIDGAARDAQRLRDLHGEGWQVEIVAELDMRRVDRLADELAVIYARRRAMCG